jgi:hypothetical protein
VGGDGSVGGGGEIVGFDGDGIVSPDDEGAAEGSEDCSSRKKGERGKEWEQGKRGKKRQRKQGMLAPSFSRTSRRKGVP